LLPQTPYDPEMDQYLGPQQLDDLKRGLPVVVSPFLERQLRLDVQRKNTALQHRVRTSLTFGISTTLEILGRLQASRRSATEMTKETAVDKALLFISPNNMLALTGILGGKSKFGTKYSNTDAVIEKLKKIQVRGSLAENQDHYGGPEGTRTHILDEIEAVKQADALPENAPMRATNAAIRFHRQVATGLIRCWEHDGQHTTAHRDWSRARQTNEPVRHGIRWTFMGPARVPIDLVDLMSLALFDLPDAYRAFQVHGAKRAYVEAAAALGSLFRGNLTRVDLDVAYLLQQIWLRQSTLGSTEAARFEPVTPDQFLWYAMMRVGKPQWWAGAIYSVRSPTGAMHLLRGHAHQPACLRNDKRFDELARSVRSNETIHQLAKLCKEAGYLLAVAKIELSLLTWRFTSDSTCILDLASIARFEDQAVARAVEYAIEATAEVLLKVIASNAQTVDRLVPGYYRTWAIVSTASSAVLSDLAPDRCEEKAVDLQYFRTFLTDAEFKACDFTGKMIGDEIRRGLGLKPLFGFNADLVANGGASNKQPRRPEPARPGASKRPTRKAAAGRPKASPAGRRSK
jgi:hypothetical protein